LIINIAILITCHNRKEKTLNSLRSLYESNISDNISFDTFLVDDGSKDGTSVAIGNKFPDVNIIKGTGSLFWNRGMHLAWQTAISKKKYDFYIWLNDDTYIFKDSIEVLLESSFKKKNKCIICGTTLNSTLSDVTYGGKDKKGNLIVPNGKVQECYYINGNFVLVPYRVYSEVGILDPIFPHAIGDYEYGLRSLKKGIKSYIPSKAIGVCEKNSSPPRWCLPEVPFLERIKNLYSPLGNSHPYYFFIYEFRHKGLFIALKHLISIHIRLAFPIMWSQR